MKRTLLTLAMMFLGMTASAAVSADAVPPFALDALSAADSCSPSGTCCAHWTAGGQCAHEYPCGRCPDPNPNCNPSGTCCAHWTAGGQCAHEYPCGRC